jgi:hypothetical protein
MWMGPQVGKRWSRSDPLSLVCSNQGGGRGSSRQNFIESKKEAPVVVCVLDFCSDDGGRATTRPEYKKRETQLCDGFAVCGRSYFRRSAFSRVHLFFLLPWEGPQVIGWIPLCTICTWPNVVHPLVQHTQGLPEYKKGGQKMSATMSISSSCLSRERQWVFRAFIYIRFRTMPKSLSGSSLFLYASSALSLFHTSYNDPCVHI